ncbi:hypothetical protein D3C77_430660 [compost metagenome]
MDEKSWPVAALLQKTFNQDSAKGLETLDLMLSKQWKAEDHIMDIAGLSEADKNQVVPAAAVFNEVTKVMPGIGTPFVMFRNSSNQLEAFGGVPLATDWSSLKATSPAK